MHERASFLSAVFYSAKSPPGVFFCKEFASEQMDLLQSMKPVLPDGAFGSF